jgi:NADPH-dependent 2,4-dienoyl-CoA reductase/sulfur reductase-like enzyme
VTALGFRANSELGGEALERALGAYKIDEFCRTNVADVYAIGDAVSSFNNVTNQLQYLAIGSATRTTAAIAANHILSLVGADAKNLRNVGTQASNGLSVFGLNLGASGLTLEAARKLGIDAKTVDFTGAVIDPLLCPESTTAELPELIGGKLRIRAVYDSETEVILGLQVASHLDIGAYVYFFSAVLMQKMTLSTLETMDLFFLPQMNQLYNPIARML